MPGTKTMTWLRKVASGHAFVQNLRRGDYEIAVDEHAGRRLSVAFVGLARAI
jgi:IS6 family transposase